MDFSPKIMALAICLLSVFANGQNDANSNNLSSSHYNSILNELPAISQDSTDAEITAHVEYMINWMKDAHYKINYAPILIYADRGLYLAERSINKDHIHNARAVIGNTLIRVKDTLKAKKLFLQSLEEASKKKDSSLILKFKGNLANLYYYTEGYKDKTINIYLESIEIAKKLEDTTKLFVLHHNLSRAYNESRNLEQSVYHVQKTEHYLNLLKNPPHYKASHLHNKGRMLLLKQKPDEAINYFKQTIKLSEEVDYTEALIEGYEGYKEALEAKEDYKGIYEISNKLLSYQEEIDKNNLDTMIESVSAKLNVEHFKEQIKSKELEKKLLFEKAESKNLILMLLLGVGIFLFIILLITYSAYQKRQSLIKVLKIKNKQYLKAKEQSDNLAKTKSKFFATVSHELRTPLYGVIGLSSILLENKDLKKHEKDLKSLKFSANYLLALVNDLLHINKIETNKFSEEDSSFDLRELTSTIMSSFEYIRLQHQNEIIINISDNIPSFLYGNYVRLSQILMNLVGNACKFTEKGTIVLHISDLKQLNDNIQLQFIVSDTGPGIERAKLKDIFNEFTQIDSMSAKYQGTGLGLPIVKKLIEHAGGKITVESELGKGTEFKFNLEFKISDASENLNSEPILDFKQLKGKQILIVEDNRINQTVTKRILENENVSCMIAQNGAEAIDLVKHNYFDLILMDINMPVKNGIEASLEIRKFNIDVPIIALTAVEIEEQKYKIFSSGMNDIVLKPYDIDLFKKAIIKNLSSKKMKDYKQMA